MASLRDAERAREEASEHLRLLGAHAISVEEDPDEIEATAFARPLDGTPGEVEPPRGPAPAEPRLPGSQAPGGQAPTEPGLPGSQAPAEPGLPTEPGLPGAAPKERRRGFAVVAWFSGSPPPTLPRCIEVRAGTRTTEVPLRVRRSEPFRAEEIRGPGIPGKGILAEPAEVVPAAGVPAEPAEVISDARVPAEPHPETGASATDADEARPD